MGPCFATLLASSCGIRSRPSRMYPYRRYRKRPTLPARSLLHALAFFLRRTLRPLRRLKRCRSRLIFYFSFNVPVMLAHISSTAAYLSPACCVQHVSHRWSGVSSKMLHASSSALNPDFRLRIGSQTLRADYRRCRSRIEHSEQMDPHAKWLYRVVESSKKEGENPLLRREASLARRSCTSRILRNIARDQGS